MKEVSMLWLKLPTHQHCTSIKCHVITDHAREMFSFAANAEGKTEQFQ